MMSKRIWIIGILLLCFPSLSLWTQSIAEKKANLQSSESDLDKDTEHFLQQINKETLKSHALVQRLYVEVMTLYKENAPPEQYRELLNQINEIKRYLNHLEQTWREMASKGNGTEGYGLWHAPDTTLDQLIIDYGSQDYVYLIPPEVGSIKLSIDSNLPIPRASWSEMLELIMSQNGVGVKTLNPYLRQLYLTKQNNAHLRLITNRRQDLEILPPEARICFVLSPEPSEVRRTFAFLEKFINPATTVLQILGRDILIIGPAGEIQDLLRLNDFISLNRGEKDFRLLPVYKMQADEMAKILGAVFDQSDTSVSISSANAGSGPNAPRSTSSSAEVNGLKIIVLQNMAQALFVIGTREEVRKAEEIVRSVESQVGGARDKVVFWYNVKHSEADELADVLYRVYSLMITTGTGFEPSAAEGLPVLTAVKAKWSLLKIITGPSLMEALFLPLRKNLPSSSTSRKVSIRKEAISSIRPRLSPEFLRRPRSITTGTILLSMSRPVRSSWLWRRILFPSLKTCCASSMFRRKWSRSKRCCLKRSSTATTKWG